MLNYDFEKAFTFQAVVLFHNPFGEHTLVYTGLLAVNPWIVLVVKPWTAPGWYSNTKEAYKLVDVFENPLGYKTGSPLLLFQFALLPDWRTRIQSMFFYSTEFAIGQWNRLSIDPFQKLP